MRIFISDHHELPLPPGHRFPIRKYADLRCALVASGLVDARELERTPLAARTDIERVHDRGYVRAVYEGALDAAAVRRIGFPWSPGLVRRCEASVGGTLAATEAALADGIAGTLAGGTHHAHRDFGAGFCVFNDIAVAAASSFEHGRVRRALILDLDVHQGDGTAAIFAGDERAFTCSIHGAKNFPARKQTSDLDVPLEDGTGDAEYLDALAVAWRVALDRARPEIVFYQAGVDPLEQDRLGRLSMTQAGLHARDAFVLEAVRAAGLPIVLTLGGGYAEPIELSIEAHLGTYRAAYAAAP